MDYTYLTQERYNELKHELEELKTTERKKVGERLKHAKELGDLSENSEYQEAREEQSRLEKNIAQIEETLRSSSIIKKAKGTGTVRIGSEVKVKKNGEKVAYIIVGSSEARPEEGFISNESLIGRALLGKKEGEEVEVETKRGKITFKILEIS